MRVAAHVSLDESTLKEEDMERLLRDVTDQEPGRTVNIDRIQRTVAERYDIRMSEMLGRGRPKAIAEARQVAMYLTRKHTAKSLADIGSMYNRDHSTVLYAIKAITLDMARQPSVREQIDLLSAKLK